MNPIHIVVEDDLSASICHKLLTHSSLDVGYVYGKEGFGYIKNKLQGFNNAAKGARYLVLIDLDQHECPAALWEDWAPGISRHPNLLFRVAVKEVESWLLADIENLRQFLGVRSESQIRNPDQIVDPKRELLNLAFKSNKRRLRESLVFQNRNGNLVQGPDYNGTMSNFVENKWNLRNAVRHSKSLKRAMKALSGFISA